MSDLDDVINDMEEMEARDSGRADTRRDTGIAEMRDSPRPDKVLVGTVEHYYSRIDVAAIRLVGTLKVGDAIEIRDHEGEIRELVTSMQIDRKDVAEAYAGDDVGIKLTNPVPEGSEVYRLSGWRPL